MTTQRQTIEQMSGKRQQRNVSQQAMELSQVIREDHDRLRSLLSKYRNSRQDGQAQLSSAAGELAKEILYRVALHEAAEEDTLYAGLQNKLSDSALISCLLDEQQEAREDIEMLMDKPPTAEGYEQKLMEIIDETEQHMADEETQLFPVLEKLGLSQKRELAAEYIERRQTLENLRI
jgi:hemerythrin-like domain-containing protein